jgi:transcriptional regulator with XRE-family HTH domain
MLREQDRKRAGWSAGRAASELGVSIREYRQLEAGKRSPDCETFDRICELFGWPQTFTGNIAELQKLARQV